MELLVLQMTSAPGQADIAPQRQLEPLLDYILRDELYSTRYRSCLLFLARISAIFAQLRSRRDHLETTYCASRWLYSSRDRANLLCCSTVSITGLCPGSIEHLLITQKYILSAYQVTRTTAVETKHVGMSPLHPFFPLTLLLSLSLSQTPTNAYFWRRK